jgi:superfamily II DNA or RNA helicase
MLRDYQIELIEKCREAFKVNDSVVMTLATGGGKSLTAGTILKSAVNRGFRSMFIVHREELIEQTAKTFTDLGIDFGFIKSGYQYDNRKILHIASVDTLKNRLDKVLIPKFIVVDEAHRSCSKTYIKILSYYGQAKKLLITATPQRLDGKGLGMVATKLVKGCQTKQLIEDGYLADYRYFASSDPDLSKVTMLAGDYNPIDLAKVIDNRIIGDAIEQYLKNCNGKQAILFAVSRDHSKKIVEDFRKAGIVAEHLDSETKDSERKQIIKNFRDKKIQVLSNVDILTEGFDVPNVQAVILLKPTQSITKYLQMIGRGLRPIYAEGYDFGTFEGRLEAIKSSEKPKAVILDHANNYKIHGLPCMDRHWTLEGVTKKDKINQSINIDVKTCRKCYTVFEKQESCPNCGLIIEKKIRKVKFEEGQLLEIEVARKPLRELLQTAKTTNDLITIASHRGYKVGWIFRTAKEKGLIFNFNTLLTIQNQKNYKNGWARYQAKLFGISQ